MRSGVDIEEDRLRVQDALNRPQLHICFAQGEGTGKELPSGAWSGGPINASYDVLVDMDAECRRALNREWNSLLEHHASAPGGRPDTSKPARPNADAPTFVCEEHPAPQVTKRMFKAGNARSAVEFLTAQPRITRPYYYVEVRTPDGLFGIDNGGFIYDANGNPVSPDRYRPSQAHAESPQRSPILDRKPSEPTVKGAGSPVTSSLPRKRWWQVWRHFS
jgi:hypothetical protein